MTEAQKSLKEYLQENQFWGSQDRESALKAVEKWLTQKGNKIDEDYDNCHGYALTQMKLGQKYLIRELLKEIHQ